MHEEQTYTYQEWPKWLYGPAGESAIFQEHDEIPPDWRETPPNQEPTHEENASDDQEDAGAQEGRQEEGLLTPKRRGRPPKVREDDF